ncbi:hypothetical protein D3C75_1215290 [compost metagenome]
MTTSGRLPEAIMVLNLVSAAPLDWMAVTLTFRLSTIHLVVESWPHGSMVNQS